MLQTKAVEKCAVTPLLKASLLALGLIGLVALSSCGISSGNHAISFSEFERLEGLTGIDTHGLTPTCTQTSNAEFGGKSCLKVRQEFRFIVYVGKQIYCYWDEKKLETGIDYDALAATLESRITDQTTFSEYFADILTPWAASFHDGHVNPMLGEDRSKLEVLHSNIRTRLLAAMTDHERVVVQTSKNSHFPIGSTILKINGVPVADVITAREQITSGSTRRMRRFGAGMRLFDAVGMGHGLEPFEVEFQPPGNGPHKTLSVVRKLEVVLPPRPSLERETEKTGEASVLAEILPGQIAYLKIDLFVGTQLPAIFNAKMSQFRQASGLILDVRDNGGGDLSGNQILRWLTRIKIVRYLTSPRRSDFLLTGRPEFFTMGVDPTDSRFTDWTPVEVEPTTSTEGTFVGKPVVALTSNYCFSACDTFVAALKANSLATIIGEATGGGTGTPEVFDLPISKAKFRYAVVRGRTALHAQIEGFGTTPDILAEYGESDLTKEPFSDSQTVKAMDFISTSLHQPTPPVPVQLTDGSGSAFSYLNAPKTSATTEELLKLNKLEKIHED